MTHQYVELTAGQTLRVDGPARITLERKSGQRARFKISAPVQTKIFHPGALECATASEGVDDGKHALCERATALS